MRDACEADTRKFPEQCKRQKGKIRETLCKAVEQRQEIRFVVDIFIAFMVFLGVVLRYFLVFLVRIFGLFVTRTETERLRNHRAAKK